MNDDFKRLVLDDPALFILHYFKHRIRELKSFHLELIEMAQSAEFSLILYPAGHGKTTLISTLLPIWALCKDPNIRIAVIAKNSNEAQSKIARVIMNELMSNQELIQDFGPFQPLGEASKSWSLTNMIVAGRTASYKEPTVAFFGSGAKDALGHRSDWVICDDVVTDRNSSSPSQRESLKKWFEEAVDTMKEFSESRLTVVGTLFDPEDLYHDILEYREPDTGIPIYDVLRVDAIIERCMCGHVIRSHGHGETRCEECECGGFALDDSLRETLWPEKWPWKRLMQQKAKGTLAFNRRFRNKAVDASRMVFKEAYIRGGWETGEKYPGCLDESYSYGQHEENWARFSGFDPAIGTTRGHAFCAHVTVAVGSCMEHERCFWIMDVLKDQMSLIQQVEMVLDQHEKYDLLASRVEANSYQQGLLDAIKRQMDQDGRAYRIEPHYTSRQNKPDPELGVQAMSPWFENGKVHIPWADPASRAKMRPLVDELIAYPGRTKDIVMALWFAWRAAEEGHVTGRSYNRLVDGPRGPTSLGRHVSRRQFFNPAYQP